MSKTATKPQDAAQELERAEQEVQEVLDRIKDVDKDVGPEDLEAAERRVRFARARLEGEERRKEEEAERERLQRIEELKERAASDLDPEPVRKLRRKAEKALSDYVAACEEYDRRIKDVADELPPLEPLPDEWRVEHTSAGPALAVGNFNARPIRTIATVSEMAHSVLREHISRGFIDLENPY